MIIYFFLWNIEQKTEVTGTSWMNCGFSLSEGWKGVMYPPSESREVKYLTCQWVVQEQGSKTLCIQPVSVWYERWKSTTLHIQTGSWLKKKQRSNTLSFLPMIGQNRNKEVKHFVSNLWVLGVSCGKQDFPIQPQSIYFVSTDNKY